MRKQSKEQRTKRIAHSAKSTLQTTGGQAAQRIQKDRHPSPITGHGFTLVELLIAITITAFALAGVYTSFVVQQRSFTTQDQVAEVDLTSKIAFDMIINDIRTAGFGYDGDGSPDINNITGIDTTGTIIPNINGSSGPNSSDTITIIGSFRQITTLQDASGLPNQIKIDSPYLSSNFNTSTRSALNIGGVFFAFISSCPDTNSDGNCDAGSVLTLDRDVTNKTALIGKPVYLVEDVTYRLSGTDLQRVKWINSGSLATDTIAENIEDLQVVDIDVTNTANEIIAKRIRISLLARTAHEDPALAPSTKPYYDANQGVEVISLENNTTTYDDQFRRRIWSMEVGLRN